MMNILYVSDNGYFNLMRLSIISVLKYNKNVIFHVLSMDSPETNQVQLSKQNKLKIREEIKQLDSMSKIIFYDVRDLYLEKLSDSLNKDTEYTPFAALRLLAPYIIDDVELLLYLDCDTLVCESLLEIFEKYKNKEFDFAATQFINGNGELGMYLTTSLLFNLNFQKRTHHQFLNEAIDIFNHYKLYFPDQEAITLAKTRKSFDLDASYNMGNYAKGYTKIFCIFYRSSEKVREFLQFLYPLKAQKVFDKMERIISELSQIQNS